MRPNDTRKAKPAAKAFVWLSFDLGVQGDYEGLYFWLDSHKARECGPNVACFRYQYFGSVVDSLRHDLRINMKFNKRTRFYVIYARSDGKMTGTFVHGSRKSSPWAGFGVVDEPVEDTDA